MYQETNKIELKLNYIDQVSSTIFDGILFNDIYYIDIIIDGINIRNNEGFEEIMIVFSEIKNSISKSGKYLIITSASGIADDGGWEGVNVLLKNSFVKWKIEFEKNIYNYSFSKDNLLKEISKIELKIKNIPSNKLEPKWIDFPEEW
ncbi:hypothetical protein [Tenacibaculum maritimum]|uniref:Uncharacterized protein n=1 Tax=Tenacibaculum maritimum NCIMB 2154 TaxID=1349785 RepID=A0A2H1ECI4_9FLAO|nr:hypothetical protein [Tenacibaculum maritimum]MCD9583339.1 hypothetical protein [Tenacibaculum maritimum]MCD9637352.1 hypothetical protein [Tenacibaculum maritimum]CAA0163751.1 conserved hypothetical protein [Tenacibaculum maritimum]CAA0166091.1 conserved hypothetical protein [Tenacibaculum maritimum]CAA0210343.1 conserved hypothetical protein [Tenacibaculum maritimum]